jgi:site-specific recombinase XerD
MLKTLLPQPMIPAHGLRSALSMVLQSARSPITKQMYRRGLQDFLRWLEGHGRSFDYSNVVTYREALQSHGYSASTINQRLSAIRKLAAAAGELSLIPLESAAGVLRIKGEPNSGRKARTFLGSAKSEELINAPDPRSLKGLRDRAILAVLVGCGLRRRELVNLEVSDIIERDGRCTLSIGEHGVVSARCVPVPGWVGTALQQWLGPAHIETGRVFRSLNRHGRLSGDSLSQQAVVDLVRTYAGYVGVAISPNDLRRTCARLCREGGADLSEIQAMLGHANIQATERLVGVGDRSGAAPNDSLQIRLDSPPVRPAKSERGYRDMARRAAR